MESISSKTVKPCIACDSEGTFKCGQLCEDLISYYKRIQFADVDSPPPPIVPITKIHHVPIPVIKNTEPIVPVKKNRWICERCNGEIEPKRRKGKYTICGKCHSIAVKSGRQSRSEVQQPKQIIEGLVKKPKIEEIIDALTAEMNYHAALYDKHLRKKIFLQEAINLIKGVWTGKI